MTNRGWFLVVLACLGGCGHESEPRHLADAGGDAADACAPVICDQPPPSGCIDESTRRDYEATGTCTDGACTYAYVDSPSAACSACAGVTCSAPPAATCADAATVRTYDAQGTCELGTCSYGWTDDACDTPPAPFCVGDSVRTFAQAGTCSAGACRYAVTDVRCTVTCEGGACIGGWVGLGSPGIDPRWEHSAVWTGSQMFVWAGVGPSGTIQNAATYTPATGQWESIPNVPGRRGATTVWTGTEVLVWGGTIAGIPEGTGWRYNPTTKQWNTISSVAAPFRRTEHSAVWTGTEMIVWGGGGDGTRYNDGYRYNPVTNTWRRMSMFGAPAPRARHTAVWTGTEMIIYGGEAGSSRGDGARYDPAMDTWTPIPDHWGRCDHHAFWTGTEMLVWGDRVLTGGGHWLTSYSVQTNTWTLLTPTTGPSPRSAASAVWTGTELIVYGGKDKDNAILTTGARYQRSTNSWTPIPADPQTPAPRWYHTAVWTGQQMIVFGGHNGTTAVAGGAVFYPVAP